MKNASLTLGLLAAVALCAAVCQAADSGAPAPATTVSNAVPSVPSTPPDAVRKAVRIKAGASTNITDTVGNIWLADQGFDGGDVIERPGLDIANTKEPEIYLSEHYGMDSFSWPVTNGKYLVKLHFAETYDGIGGPGERVFSFTVQGKEFKDFDVWKKSGGLQKAYVESVPVEVTDGKLFIKFTSNVENPQINGIEILPAD